MMGEPDASKSMRVPIEHLLLAGDIAGVRALVRRMREFTQSPIVVCCNGEFTQDEWTPLPEVRLCERLEEAMALDGARKMVVGCHSRPSRSWAIGLLDEAARLGLRVFASEPECVVEGGHRVVLRRWSLRDVLSPDLAGQLSERDMACFRGKRVLVTGAGGSIGSALVEQLAACRPASIGLLDYSEFNLFQVEHALRAAHPKQAFTPMLCDVRDADGVRRWFERARPEVVFHAAALKHVPIVEMHASQGVLTNVGGTRSVAAASRLVGADLVFVSTDKAVNPVNVMGVTKRLGELLCQALDCEGGSRHIPVRLGNVLGSAGSVSPLFARQIAGGGPVTVTHPGVTRYFITIQQAAEFLLRAAIAAFADPERRGLVRTLEMGDPVKIMDLARIMILLEGRRPDADVQISLVGLRPGEKLQEQLIADSEEVLDCSADGINAVRSPRRELPALQSDFDVLMGLAQAGRDEKVAHVARMALTEVQVAALAG